MLARCRRCHPAPCAVRLQGRRCCFSSFFRACPCYRAPTPLLCDRARCTQVATREACRGASARQRLLPFRRAPPRTGEPIQVGWTQGQSCGLQRLGVVPTVAVTPSHWVSKYHEAGDVINDLVHPACFEGCAMTALMPAAITSRTVKHAIG